MFGNEKTKTRLNSEGIEPIGVIPQPLTIAELRHDIKVEQNQQESAVIIERSTIQDKIKEKIDSLQNYEKKLIPDSPTHKVNTFFLTQYSLIMQLWGNKTAKLHQQAYDYLNIIRNTYLRAVILNIELLSVIYFLGLDKVQIELDISQIENENNIVDILSARMKIIQFYDCGEKLNTNSLNTFLSQIDNPLAFLGSKNTYFIMDLIKCSSNLNKTCFEDDLFKFMSHTIQYDFMRYIYEADLGGNITAANKYLAGLLKGFDKNEKKYVIEVTPDGRLLIEPIVESTGLPVEKAAEPDDENGSNAELRITSSNINLIIPAIKPKKFGNFFNKHSNSILVTMRTKLEEYQIKFNDNEWTLKNFVTFIIPDNTDKKPSLSYFMSLLNQGLGFMIEEDCEQIVAKDIYDKLMQNPAILSHQFTPEEQKTLIILATNYLKALGTSKRALDFKQNEFVILEGDNAARINSQNFGR